MKVAECANYSVYNENGKYKFLNKKTTLIDYEVNDAYSALQIMEDMQANEVEKTKSIDLEFGGWYFRNCILIERCGNRVIRRGIDRLKRPVFFVTTLDNYVIAMFVLKQDAEMCVENGVI